MQEIFEYLRSAPMFLLYGALAPLVITMIGLTIALFLSAVASVFYEVPKNKIKLFDTIIVVTLHVWSVAVCVWIFFVEHQGDSLHKTTAGVGLTLYAIMPLFVFSSIVFEREKGRMPNTPVEILSGFRYIAQSGAYNLPEILGTIKKYWRFGEALFFILISAVLTYWTLHEYNRPLVIIGLSLFDGFLVRKIFRLKMAGLIPASAYRYVLYQAIGLVCICGGYLFLGEGSRPIFYAIAIPPIAYICAYLFKPYLLSSIKSFFVSGNTESQPTSKTEPEPVKTQSQSDVERILDKLNKF